jgi:Arc/MetJ-type ribon-helix-helix transcriptional regulator
MQRSGIIPGVKVRVTIEAPPVVRNQIESLVKRTNAGSMTEVVRKAIGLYEHCVAAKEQGGKILIERADGTMIELVNL